MKRRRRRGGGGGGGGGGEKEQQDEEEQHYFPVCFIGLLARRISDNVTNVWHLFKRSHLININLWALCYDAQLVDTQPFIRSTAPFRLSTTACSRLPFSTRNLTTPHAVVRETYFVS